MPRGGWTPVIVPYGADQTIYLVVDRFEPRGGICREIEIERTDIETIVADFIAGQFNDPVRVVSFNTLEHWSRDVSEEIAAEIQTRCDIDGAAIPEHIRDFVVNRTGRSASPRCGLPDPEPQTSASKTQLSLFHQPPVS